VKLNSQDDVEHRLAALIAKDGIRIRQFFIDFDKLRKGYCGEAAVSKFIKLNMYLVPHMHWDFEYLIN
jgi:hypothetical protein